MNITRLTLKNSRVAMVLLAAITIMGVKEYLSAPRDDAPPRATGKAVVVCNFPGAAPQRVESLVTKRLEEIIRETPEVKNIESESRTGVSIITAELKNEVGKNQSRAVRDRLRVKMNAARAELPAGVLGPVVKDEDIGAVYDIILALKSEGVPYNILEKYAKDIRGDLIRLPDAAKVALGGVRKERVFIEFDNARLAEHNLSADKLRAIIGAANTLFPGGEINIGKKRIILETAGNYQSIKELKRTPIPTSSGEAVFLEDIVRVYKDYVSPVESFVRVGGMSAVSLSISLKDGADITELGRDVERKLKEINSSLPLGLELVRTVSLARVVNRRVSVFSQTLTLSALIVMAATLIFTGLRAGAIVAALVSMAIAASLFFMGTFGVGLNNISLGALIMSLGLLTNTGIVVVESILVLVERGESVFDACVGSCKTLTGPLLISALSASAAFLPFLPAEMATEELASPVFWTVAISLLCSLALAFTFVPLLALVLVKAGSLSESGKLSYMDRLNLWYNRLLLRTLKRPLPFLLFIVCLFFVSLWGLSALPFKPVTDSDRNLVAVDIEFPVGTRIEVAKAAVEKIESYIERFLSENAGRDRGAADYSSYIGVGPEAYDSGYFKKDPGSNYAHMLLSAAGDLDSDLAVEKLERYCHDNIPGAEIRVSRLAGPGAVATPVEIRLFGKDPGELHKIAEEVKTLLINTKGTKNISDDQEPKIKKIVVNINEAKAQRAGLGGLEIAAALNAALSGTVVGDFKEDEKRVAIVLKAESDREKTIRALAGINIYSPRSGADVPLFQVASIETERRFAKIKRRNLRRAITVGAYLKQGYTSGDIFKSVALLLKEKQKTWKPGYDYELGGEYESVNETLEAVFKYLPVSVFLIALLLIIQFNSFRKTAIILLTIPLGLVGVVFGWLAAGSFVSFFGILGVIAVAAILINGSVVLVDRVDAELESAPDLSRQEALIEAANHNFRPALTTAFAASLGASPLYFGGGSLWESPAMAVIFGALFAAPLILLFAPALYKIFFRINFEEFQLNMDYYEA